MKGSKRVIVVDDEPQIARMLRAALQSSGFEVATAKNGVEALEMVRKNLPDLIITDLAMPEMDGIELTRAVREFADTPIIVLSVRDADMTKVAALDLGADDYLTKPFSTPELLARVRVHMRRTEKPAEQVSRVEAGQFVIDAEEHTATIANEAVHLTPKEFDLLLLFARNPLRVLTHKVLLRGVWGPAGEDQPEYLRVLVAQLRKKIERSGGARFIISEPWVGYRFHPAGVETELTTS